MLWQSNSICISLGLTSPSLTYVVIEPKWTFGNRASSQKSFQCLLYVVASCVCVFFCLLILKHKQGMYKSLLKNINNKQYYDSLTSSYYSKLIFSISFKCITNNLFTTIAFPLVGMNDQCYKHNQKSAIFDIWQRANTRPLKLNWNWRCYNCC